MAIFFVDIDMPYTMKDFQRDFTRDHLNLLAPEERLREQSKDQNGSSSCPNSGIQL